MHHNKTIIEYQVYLVLVTRKIAHPLEGFLEPICSIDALLDASTLPVFEKINSEFRSRRCAILGATWYAVRSEQYSGGWCESLFFTYIIYPRPHPNIISVFVIMLAARKRPLAVLLYFIT